MADDATAAFANPSGLVQLARPEISMELRIRAEFDEAGFAGEATTLSGVGFLSFVYPRGDWSVALYRHQFGAAESPSGLVSFDDIISPPDSGLDIDAPAELEIVTTAVAVAYRPRDSFSLGLGISRFRGSLESELVEDHETQRIRVDDSDWGLNAGFLWTINNQLNLGGFYRQSPSFEGTEEVLYIEGSEASRGAIRFPDSFGLGLAFRTKSGALATSVEWDHIRYSAAGGGLFSGITLDDSNEFHVGIEYAFIGITPVFALRGGAWFEPEQTIRFVEDGQVLKRSGRWHGAFGLGLSFWRLQFDLGFEVSDYVATVSLSAIVSF
jgi:long-subunit fatty acid transport protein